MDETRRSRGSRIRTGFLVLGVLVVAVSPAHPDDCTSRDRLVGDVSASMSRVSSLLDGGDPAEAFRACESDARTLIREHPDCPDVRRYLEESLARARTLGRSTDRVDVMLRSFDEIITAYADTGRTDVAAAETPAGGHAASPLLSDLAYWLSDPYFLFLEILLLLMLLLYRDLKRLRRNSVEYPPRVRPFRYRLMPERKTGTPRSGGRPSTSSGLIKKRR